MSADLRFNPPPGWPRPPAGWVPPSGWTPDPSWPEPPPDWQLWVRDGDGGGPPTDTVLADEAPLEPTTAGNVASSARLTFLEVENAELRERLAEGAGALDSVELDDSRVLQSVGIYRYHHPLESAAGYLEELKAIEARVSELVRRGGAISSSDRFTFNNSLAQGRKMSSDLGRLMLRAYNAEAENVIRALRVSNVEVAKRRLQTSRDAIARLGALMQLAITDEYHDLRLEEVALTADWLMKKQEEREAQREAREELREQRRVERELAAERERLDKERGHLENAIAALAARGETDPQLAARLDEVDRAIADNDFRAANIRAGYVYVISNRGAFGRDVVKIGLTRRLEPRDRVAELGGASVPFKFDTHTLFFSEDAVGLENELHRHFADRAVNRANPRKEFFFASPLEVRDVLLDKVGALLEFTEEGAAEEFHQSRSAWPDSEQP